MKKAPSSVAAAPSALEQNSCNIALLSCEAIEQAITASAAQIGLAAAAVWSP
jgi:hypothetical protein